jgi:hypothetical protein
MTDRLPVVIAALAVVLALVMWIRAENFQSQRDDARLERDAWQRILHVVEPFTWEQERRLDRLERRVEERQRDYYELFYGS